ncbi:MAG: hypothetical protein ACJART_000150 [Maribacter sp.]|jgi:hypothetical protein
MSRNNLFTVNCRNFNVIQELPNSWSQKDFKKLLSLLEYRCDQETSQRGLKETVLACLSRYATEEAAKIILDYVFSDRLTKGQILSISKDMLAERSWEEHPNMAIHKELFKVNQLLYLAFSGQFPHPEAVHFQVNIKANKHNWLSVFDDYPEAALIRLLVAAMPEDNLILRLFEEQIAGTEFKDAKDIIWQLRTEKSSASELIFDVVSSPYWFQDIEFMGSFEAETHPDLKRV